MKKLIFICLWGAFFPVFSEQNPFKTEEGLILAQSETTNTFDPFIDYGEFQDNVTEEKSIIFFQSGRSLTLSLLGGYEAISFNMRQIYGDAPFIFGMAVSFFFDLRFALQVSGFFPHGHYDSLLNTMSKFSHYGMEFKYYLNRQYMNENADFFNPYIIFGPFWFNIKPDLSKIPKFQKNANSTPTQSPNPTQDPNSNPNTIPIPTQNPSLTKDELDAVPSHSSFGAKIGVGCEIPLIKQSFIGLEVSYLYTNLQHENQDLSHASAGFPPPNNNPNQNLIERLQFPNRPQLSGNLFFGDLINVVILFGVNF